jgi:hypothetical protein
VVPRWSPVNSASIAPYRPELSLTEVAHATSRIPQAQNRTVGKLLANPRARKVTGDVADLAQAHPGEIFWRSYGDEASWTAVSAPPHKGNDDRTSLSQVRCP